MKRKLDVHAKCRFWIDDEGWLEVFDGHATIGFGPDEAKALRDFLAEGPVRLPAEPEQSPTGNPQVTPGAVQGGPLEVDGAGLVDAFMDQVESFVKAEYTEDETARFKEKVMLAMRATLINSFAALRSSPPGPARPVELKVEAHGSAVEFKWINLDDENRTIRADFPLRVANEIAYRINSFNPAEPPKVEGKGP